MFLSVKLNKNRRFYSSIYNSATCLLGSIAIFGTNSIDLLMAAWQTKKQDGYMEPKEIYPNQDICFPYFSEDDMDIVLAEQEHLREMKQLQDEINYELTGRH